MTNSFERLREGMSPERRRRNAESAEALLAVLDLAALRTRLGLTQDELATRLEVAQSSVSRLEGRRDIHVSTLRHAIEALGGGLLVVASFRNERVLLERFSSPAWITDTSAEDLPWVALEDEWIPDDAAWLMAGQSAA